MEEQAYKKRVRVLGVVEGVTLAKEKEELETRFTFPDLVFKELLAMILVTVVLIVWSLLANAPLSLEANPARTENPAKAPWYFLGLQELLVYFDPWMAGVIIPNLIVVGLIVIPYIDTDNKVSGGYVFGPRKLAISIFMFGTLLWFGLMFVGTVLRGPSWMFYWPWESWEIAKHSEEVLWNLPMKVGGAALLIYGFIGMTLPAVLSPKFFKQFGIIRYFIVMNLLLFMMLVPIKMILRLIFNIKYILVTPWFNI